MAQSKRKCRQEEQVVITIGRRGDDTTTAAMLAAWGVLSDLEHRSFMVFGAAMTTVQSIQLIRRAINGSR
jgi:hypothetical protein